jgi:peptide chain release factor subunit 1
MPALKTVIDQLAAFEPSEHPVISLYLNLQPDQRGRDNYNAFVRKEFKQRLESYPPRDETRAALERDVERIRTYLDQEVNRAAQGLALFACGPRDLFEAVQLSAPVDEHRLYIDHEPHLYPLARLDDQFPRYAAMLLDTNSARLFVFGAGEVERRETLQNQKTRRSQVGGWSQARYQRHVENFHLQHVKEAVDMLTKVVRSEAIPRVILSGDPVVIPLVREQLAPDVAERVIDTTRLDTRANEREVLEATLESLRERDASDDRERVGRLLDEYRGGGLAVVGAEDTRAALELGQVDELLISAALDKPLLPPLPEAEGGHVAAVAAQARRGIAPGADTAPEAAAAATTGAAAAVAETPVLEQMAEELVTKAAQTAARVTFIEDHALLAPVGGVGARLRFRI